MNTIITKNTTSNSITIGDLRSFSVTVSGTVDMLEFFKPEEIARSNNLLAYIASEELVINNGNIDLTPGEAVRYVSLHKHLNPLAPDGREIIRADSRPEDTETYFTSTGDSATDIGDGESLFWDFSNNDSMYTVISGSNGPGIPSGMKGKVMDLTFLDPIYIKEGTIYFTNAPKGSYASMFVMVPQGGYYPNPAGTIPAVALGLTGNTMYAYAATHVYYTRYVNRQFMDGSCPMGDELNAEGCQINAMPAGWFIRCIVFTDENETTFRGHASLELYRKRTILLPGETI